MVGEIVVVFNGFEGCGLAEESEVVDRDWRREDSLDSYVAR